MQIEPITLAARVPLRPRVLIIDGDVLVVGGLARLLKSRNLSFEVNASYTEARRTLSGSDQSFRVVVMDSQLGDQQGGDLLARIADMQRPPKVIIYSVTLTTLSDSEVRPPVVAVLSKSLPVPRLAPFIDEACRDRAIHVVSAFFDRYALSKREREVLLRAIDGKSSKEIAWEMGCHTGTIDSYWARIGRKTGVGSRNDVVGRLLRLIIQNVI